MGLRQSSVFRRRRLGSDPREGEAGASPYTCPTDNSERRTCRNSSNASAWPSSASSSCCSPGGSRNRCPTEYRAARPSNRPPKEKHRARSRAPARRIVPSSCSPCCSATAGWWTSSARTSPATRTTRWAPPCEKCTRAAATVLLKYVGLEPVIAGEEGRPTVVEPGFEPAAVKLVGTVAGEPPFRGVLRHRGWRAGRVDTAARHGSRGRRDHRPGRSGSGMRLPLDDTPLRHRHRPRHHQLVARADRRRTRTAEGARSETCPVAQLVNPGEVADACRCCRRSSTSPATSTSRRAAWRCPGTQSLARRASGELARKRGGGGARAARRVRQVVAVVRGRRSHRADPAVAGAGGGAEALARAGVGRLS